MPIGRTSWVDDDGSGTLGTLIRNAELQAIYDAIDAATWDAVQLTNISSTPQPKLFGTRNLQAHVVSNTTFAITADFIAFMKPSTPFSGIVLKESGNTYTVNVSTAGPAANGRDQAGAFSVSSWIYFYLIYDPTTGTVAGISSASPPPTGPTFPGGGTTYNQWTYVCAVRFDGSSHLVPCHTMGNTTYYDTRQTLLSGGTSAGPTSLNTTLATLVPPSACGVTIDRNFDASSGTLSLIATIQHISGSDYSVMTNGANATAYEFEAPLDVPLSTAQTIYYKSNGVPFTLYVLAYCDPNGAN